MKQGEPSSVIEPLQQFWCKGFRALLTPFACMMNQIYQERWRPCETCTQGATIMVAPPVPKPEAKPRDRRKWNRKDMSLAVARSLGYA